MKTPVRILAALVGAVLCLPAFPQVQLPPGGEVQAKQPEAPLLRPRHVPEKEKEIVLDPERSIAGLFVVKFVEGSHVRLGKDGLFVDETAAAASPDERRRLARAVLDFGPPPSGLRKLCRHRTSQRKQLAPARVAKELSAVAETLRAYRKSHGFELAPLFRPPGFVYSLEDEERDAPFREKDALEQRSGEELADLDLYYVVYAKDFRDLEAQQALMNRLNAFRLVEQVYAAAPAEGADVPTPDLSGSQGYLLPAPGGLDALYAWTQPGGRGDGVRLIDVEYDWVTDHEDFAPESQRFWGGRPVCPYDGEGSEHGTAVMGIVAALENGLGITGFAPRVQYGFSSACRPFDYVWAAIVGTFSGES